jgi:urease accessory protein
LNHATAQPQDIFAGSRAPGRITLQVGAAGGVSRRTKVREEGPLRVRFAADAGRRLEAVVVNTAGGVAGGDSSVLDLAVDDGASLMVTTSAAEKVYRSPGPSAAMTVNLKVGAGASLAWMPREMILLGRSRLDRAIDIELANDSRLLLAEAVVFARADAGEDGVFSDRWRVRRSGQLIYSDTTTFDGAGALEPARRGAALATILMAPDDDLFVAALRSVQDRLRGEVAASSANGLTLARFSAADGPSLRQDLVTALTIALGAPTSRWVN